MKNAQTPHGAVTRYAAARFGIRHMAPPQRQQSGRWTIQGTDVHGGRFLVTVDCGPEGWHAVTSYGAHVSAD